MGLISLFNDLIKLVRQQINKNPHAGFERVGLLSLSNDLIKLVGQQVIKSPDAGLRAWCRVTSTCKRLWDMQLPESSSEWRLDVREDFEGETKAKQAQLTQGNLLCIC